MLCPLAMAFTCYLCGSGKLNSFKFHFLDLLLSFTVFVTLPFPSHILTNLLLSGMWEASSGCECVCAFMPDCAWVHMLCGCKYVCVNVDVCFLYFLLSTVTTSATNCNTHHVFLSSPPLPSFSPSLPQTRAAQWHTVWRADSVSVSVPLTDSN